MKDIIDYEVDPKFYTAEQLAELDETSRKQSNTVKRLPLMTVMMI